MGMSTSAAARVRYVPSPVGASTPTYQKVRELGKAMLAEGRAEEALDYALTALAAVLEKSRDLELLLAKMRRAQAGKTTERVDPGQMALLFEELVAQLGTEAEGLDPEAEARADAELEAELEAAREAQGERPSEASPGWRTREVAKEIHRVEVAVEARRCARCGGEQARIGEDVSRVLDYVPGHFVEHEYHLEKWACPRCKRGVTTAPGPAKVIERSAAGASLLAHVVVSKYADHTPLHRLHRMYERSGATIPVSTLSDWVGEVGSLLEPLVERLAARIVGEAYVVGTDATGLKVLDPQSPENVERGTIWCMVGDERDVVFRYTPTGEGAAGPWSYLAGRRGYIQADAAGVFDRLFNGAAASAIEVGCWAHARRRFIALQDSDCRVAYPIKLIGRLYRIEKLADAKGLSVPERTELRRTRSGPVLDTLKRWLLTTTSQEPPKSDLAQAAAYVIHHWTALTRFVEDGRLRLDNNLVERQIRDIALGRRNYLFAGSHAAAQRSAAIYSLLRTAAQHGVAPIPYLTDVLTKLAAGWDPDRLDELLPERWRATLVSAHAPGPAPPT